ncbi:pseudouridine synthase [Rhodomicrobium udaipurense JA643]|uniref:23S rRNA (Guanosine(2251)-2'-O)-methyltransferase RlmB n=1 Tax=Rhodomicrobium udaipurense TaxID=1202716 RepID=A0A8I1GD31_9HYPH|nr:23S rRNA (guanosine(2251)-2'-O)-methyltransferase RlmB [Rhodomicrobium udaipurense]KAI94768.1 pseudouridine synthase [Rhodomicrobium udaipurense JA643]MBJ7542684.1 23S rRNA (guanosine(2251)-2'-O)-methyltransferase RlmB [Rhodomicrobium udaipurense]
MTRIVKPSKPRHDESRKQGRAAGAKDADTGPRDGAPKQEAWAFSRFGDSRKSARRPKSAGESFAKLAAGETLYGLHSVEAALANPKRRVRHAWLTENAAARLRPLIDAREIAATLALPADLDALTGPGAVHQGAVLQVEPLAQPGLDDFLDALGDAPAAVVILDQVTDPHNVGAVLRSAAAFGIGALIVQDRHSPPLTGALAKSASGGLEHVPVIEVVNLARVLEKLKERDFLCIGFDSEGAQRFDAALAGGRRVAFVFGAEDKGLRRLVREGCDAIAALSAPGPIKSLNISNAAAIVFHARAQGQGEAK